MDSSSVVLATPRLVLRDLRKAISSMKTPLALAMLSLIAILIFAIPTEVQAQASYVQAATQAPELRQKLDRIKERLANLHPIYRVPPQPGRAVPPECIDRSWWEWRPQFAQEWCGYDDATTTALQKKLDELKIRLAFFRTQFTDRHPDVIQLQAEIAALVREIAASKDQQDSVIPIPPADPFPPARP